MNKCHPLVTLAASLRRAEKLQAKMEETRDIDHTLDGRIYDMRYALESASDDALNAALATAPIDSLELALLEDERTRRAYAEGM